ncbi:MAG: hypothetical protein ABR549_07695 [Mycobacteriales bacterium]
MGSRRPSYVDRFAGVGLIRSDLEAEAVILLVDSHLHSDDDAICPRCLGWIDERQFVRQTAYGLFQHEVCPPNVPGR